MVDRGYLDVVVLATDAANATLDAVAEALSLAVRGACRVKASAALANGGDAVLLAVGSGGVCSRLHLVDAVLVRRTLAHVLLALELLLDGVRRLTLPLKVVRVVLLMKH